MIFSKNKWKNADEMRPYIPVSNALSFETVGTALQNAFGLFIRPLLGDTLCTKLEGIYETVMDPGEVREGSKDKKIRFLYLAQRANALLAFWYDYDELQVLIGDAGIKRQESDKAKTPYKYQEQSLKAGWKSKGFNALDDLLLFLETNTEDFPDYKDSPNYTLSRSSIVRTTADIQKYYDINNSRLLFLRLRSHFQVVEDTIIEPRLGAVIYKELKTFLSLEQEDERLKVLWTMLVPVVVFYSIHRLLLETGNITDKGLFFSTLKGDNDSYESLQPVTDERVTLQAKRAEADAILYWKKVERYVSHTFEHAATCRNELPRRDNNHKRSFWA